MVRALYEVLILAPLSFYSCFQALRLFCLASELESRAAALRLEALQHMTISMAGVDGRELFTLMTTFFGHGTDFSEDPFRFLDGAPTIRPPLDLTDMDTDDEEGEKADSSTPASLTPASAASAGTAAPPGPYPEIVPLSPLIAFNARN